MDLTDNKKPIGTICFPTYNRGRRLLATIRKLLPRLSNNWVILVADNASIKYSDDYKKIKRLASSSDRLRYFRHKKNGLFEGNLVSLFRLVETQFFIVVSDEDMPVLESLEQMVPFLEENRDIGGIRTSIGVTSELSGEPTITYSERVFERGEGIENGLNGNYITGQIYNNPLLNSFHIPQRLEDNIHANQWYPHLYLNILTGANTKTIMSPIVACLRGEAETYRPEETKDYFGPFSLGTRIDQFVALRNALYEGFVDKQKLQNEKEFNSKAFYSAYLYLCGKYLFLTFRAQGKMYREQGIDHEYLMRSLCLFFIGSVQELPSYDDVKDALADRIFLLGQYWIKEGSKYYTPPLRCPPVLNVSDEI